MSIGRPPTILRLIQCLEEAALVFLMGTLIGTAFAQIILRNLLSITFVWSDPWSATWSCGAACSAQ